MHMFSDDEGKLAVEIARRVIEAAVRNEKAGEIEIPQNFKDDGGVFTTITRYPEGELRGCIGYSEPVMPIVSAIIRSARSAATRDLRFRPVKSEELDTLVISVSLLTRPTRLMYSDPRDLPSLIKVGRHGLIAKKDRKAGLLLPQVPVEQGWDAEVFLNQVCVKAGLPYRSWKNGNVELHLFTAEVFEEEEPRGAVVRKAM